MARRRSGGTVGSEFNRTRAFKGFSYAHQWRGTLVVRGWPKARGTPKSSTTRAQNSEFARLIQSIKEIDPDTREAARQLAENTAYTYRDILIMAATGSYIQIEGAENMSIQEQLDTITTTLGAMLVRTDLGWVALMPGNDGDRLRSLGPGFSPIWQTPPIATDDQLGEVIVDNNTIVVDLDGVISATAAAVPIATDSVLGKVKPDTVTTTINAFGVISATAAAVPAATGSTLGKVKPDGTTITVDGAGTITATAEAVPIATTSTPGRVIPDGTTITVDGDGVIQAVNTVTGSYGLFSPRIPAIPTLSNTGFATWINQGGASITDGPQGLIMTVPASATVNLRSRSKNVPASTPYTITALIGLDSRHVDFSGAYIGWSDGTKIQALIFRHANGVNQLEVDNFTNSTTYSATPALMSFIEANPIWVRLFFDGTNLFWQYSFVGDSWQTLYTVTPASGFLGSTGYTKLVFGGHDQSSFGCGASLLAYLEA